MFTAASRGPDPNPRGRGQLPNPDKCNSTLTSGTREEALTPNPNECNSTLTSGIKVYSLLEWCFIISIDTCWDWFQRTYVLITARKNL